MFASATRLAACGGSHERGEVGRARPRRHAGAEHDEPAIGRDSIEEPAESLAERPGPRVPLDDRDLRAKPRETPDEPLRRCEPHRRQGLFQRTGRGSRCVMDDADDGARHRQTVAHASEVVVPRTRAYVGLGSNLGDATATMADAIHALDDLPHMRVVGVSRLYATAPVGVLDQPEFRNAVVALRLTTPGGELGASGLLAALKGLEHAFGRQARARWGPRELDLDLLVFGRWAGTVPRIPGTESLDPAKQGLALTVPHPDAQRRLFVLAPLADLAPGLVPPGWGETVAMAAARRRVEEGEAAVRPIARWSGRWVPLA